MQGELISIAANRSKLKRIAALSAKIHALKWAHKLSLATKSLADLLKAREELLEELGKTLNHKYILTQKLFYEFGNKSGKLLARALQHKKAATTIHTIKDPGGNIFVSSEDIANQFVQCFSKLYNLSPTHTTGHPLDRQEAIKDFLTQYSPSLITPEDSAGLEHPVSAEETTTALKQLKMGKSPEPDRFTMSYYKSFHEIPIPHFIKAFN